MEEPLLEHPVYEKVLTLCSAGQLGVFTQAARNRQTGELVTIKFLPRGWDNGTTISRASESLNHMELSLVKHPHIVEFKGAFLTPRYLALILEYVEGETLDSFLEKCGGRMVEALARFVFQQLILAVEFCHRKGKVLRDIKLGNTLLGIWNGQLPLLKLCDFSISRDVVRDPNFYSQEGSAHFAAPEVMQNAFGGHYDGMKADVWSCGIILYIIVLGHHPFVRDQDVSLGQASKVMTMLRRALQQDFDHTYPPGCEPPSAACLNLMESMLKANPKERASCSDITAHPWFKMALPEGAATMNDCFLAPMRTLSSEHMLGFHSLLAKAAKDDGDCQVQMQPEPIPYSRQQLMDNAEPALTRTAPAQAPPPELPFPAADAAAAAAHRFAQGISGVQARKLQQQRGLAQPVDTLSSQQMDLQAALAASAEGLEVEASGWSRLWEGPPSASNQPTFLSERLKRLSQSNNSLLMSIEDAVMSMPFDDLLEPAPDAQNLLVEAMARHRRKQQWQEEPCGRGGVIATAAADGTAGQGCNARAMVLIEDRAPGSDPFLPSERPVQVSGGLFGSASLLDSAAGMSHAQVSTMVGLNFNWDIYNSVFTSSSEDGNALSLLEDASRPGTLGVAPSSAAATRLDSSQRLESPPEVVANDSLWARIVREAAAAVEPADTGARLHPAVAETTS